MAAARTDTSFGSLQNLPQVFVDQGLQHQLHAWGLWQGGFHAMERPF